jgi:Domain of unknown function (DUF397)
VSSIDFPGARWRTSSYSNGQANCVQAARVGPGSGLVAVRDSKAPTGAVLAFGPSAWRRFTATLKASA